jgi:hypothetical protein
MKPIHRLVQLGALFVTLLLGACALSPYQPKWNAKSDALLDEQLAQVRTEVAKTPTDERVLVYMGFAMNSLSKAFQGDVLLGKKAFAALNPNFASVVLSDELQTSELTYPFATQATAAKTFTEVGKLVKGRKAAAVVLISTHGLAEVLTVNIADGYLPPIRPPQLAKWLDELGDTPIVVVLSACYSGSFIDALKAPNRAVFTAAAANRSSFGCTFESQNTYFVEALLGPGFSANLTWNDWFAQTQRGVAVKETSRGMKPPSNPQASIFAGSAEQASTALLTVLGK